MLSLVITDCEGVKKDVSSPLTVILNSETDVPADDLTVTFPYNKELSENADYITAFNNGKLIFKGQIDEISNIKTSRAVITKITARSLAALLLDNEAEPVTYINPASEFIFNKHLKPFGITEYTADEVPFYGSLKIDKGMTHWQVFKNFCKNLYGVDPRITGDGKALFKGYDVKEIVTFGDLSGDIVYYSIKENKKRCELISEVRLKLEEYGGYDSHIYNKNSNCKNIERVRYVNATADTSTIDTADKIIAQSNANSRLLTLECMGCQIDVMGKNAVINDSILGKIDNLRTDRLKYTVDSNGERTTICLRKGTL